MSKLRVFLILLSAFFCHFNIANAQSENPTLSSRKVTEAPIFLLKEVWKFDLDNYPFSITWSSDGSLLAMYTNYSNKILVLDANGHLVSQINRTGDHFSGRALQFIGNSVLITRPASASDVDGVLSLWDVRSGTLINTISGLGHELVRNLAWAHAIAVSANQKEVTVLTGSANNPKISVYSAETWKLKEVLSTNLDEDKPIINVDSISYSPDGAWLAVTSSNDIMIYNASDYTLSKTFKPFMRTLDGCCISGISFGNNSKQIAISSFSSGVSYCKKGCKLSEECCHKAKSAHQIRLLNLLNGEWIDYTLGILGPIRDVTSRRQDGVTAFILNNKFYVWDSDGNYNESQDVDGTSIMFSPNGEFLAVCDHLSVKLFSLSPQ